MYFLQTNSYVKAVEQCDKFYVELTYVDGIKIQSSGLPKSAYQEIIDAISLFYEVKTPWTMWNKEKQTVTIVPYEQIRSIDVVII